MQSFGSNNLSVITPEITIFWFRRDLRLTDNAGLFHALHENNKVLPLFIFDTTILEELDDSTDARVEFILDSLQILKKELEDKGSTILTLFGNPVDIFRIISPRAVYANYDYEPGAVARDKKVAESLSGRNIPFRAFKDQVIFEKNEIVKDDGSPYTIYTPYSRKWRARLQSSFYKSYSSEKYDGSFLKHDPFPLPTLKELGFKKSGIQFPPRTIMNSRIARYEQTRNFPGIDGTSRLGVHLRFGTVSIRKLVRIALKTNETWLNELIWREFFSMILFHFPRVATGAFKPAYEKIEWINDEKHFELWCEGKTGYPIVDAGMRELNATGFMHNRVRMITASFLTKHLLIDWRWGEAYFAKKLLDFDLASNNGGWQWAAGCGCDAAPYFRVFNPTLQAEKFDPKQEYIKRWLPEYGSATYPDPIVEHVFARERAILAYRKALA